MNKDNQQFIENLKFKIASSNYIESINTKEEKVKNRFLIRKKIIATACASITLVSGIAIATNIQKNKIQDRGIGGGVQTAIENGYIAEQNKTLRNNSNNSNNVTIEDFMMDDTTLSTKFLFEFGDNTIDLSKVTLVELTDLIVRDEENRIIYGGNDDVRFKKYCEENNLNYVFTEFNDNYMNCGVNSFIMKKDAETNSLEIMYNMYTSNYPKSKKLYFSLEKITLIGDYKDEKREQQEIRNIINGKWESNVDVPEIMYNRSNEYYKFVSCDNKDFEVYSAKVSNTGFELGVIISNIENPNSEQSNDITQKIGKINEDYSSGKISYNEATELWNKYVDLNNQNYPISIMDHNIITKEKTFSSYIENSNEEKFYSTLSATRNAKNYFIEGNKFDFYDTFSLTKYNTTDKLKVVLYYYGTPVTIHLEKIK